MSVLSVAVKHLVALGMSGDALAAAIAEMEAEIETRSPAAIRQARYRHNKTSQAVTRDADVTPPPSLDKEIPPTPPKEIKPTPQAGNTRAREATRLPDEWKPAKLSRDTVAGEIVERRGQEWARRTLESFTNHWRSANGPNARKRDWQATWANWVIAQDGRDGQRTGQTQRVGGNGRGNSASGMGPTVDAANRFLARRGLSAATSQ